MRKSAPLFCALLLSLSVRRAWIEIVYLYNFKMFAWSLSVRRAWIEMPKELNRPPPLTVALRKESVDRNFYYADRDADWVVALRKESVDRNFHVGNSAAALPVALRKESVDRNITLLPFYAFSKCRSP